MKPPFLLAAAALVALGCNTGGGSPTPTPPTQTLPSPSTIYGELAEAGCYRSDAGVSFVTKEGELPHPPKWFSCLEEGGTISACGVPCGREAGAP